MPVDADRVALVLSADDMIARQRKPPPMGAVPVKKPQTAAALVARLKDEQAQAVAGPVSFPTSSGANIAETVAERELEDAAAPLDGGELAMLLSEAPQPAKSSKRVSFAPDDRLVEVRTYVPENPSQMYSTKAALRSGERRLAVLDQMNEKVRWQAGCGVRFLTSPLCRI